jgi:hypothetical protein
VKIPNAGIPGKKGNRADYCVGKQHPSLGPQKGPHLRAKGLLWRTPQTS